LRSKYYRDLTGCYTSAKTKAISPATIEKLTALIGKFSHPLKKVNCQSRNRPLIDWGINIPLLFFFNTELFSLPDWQR